MKNFENIENVKPLKNGLRLINEFNPIIYDTIINQDKKEKNIPGLLAEDVIKFYPELVKMNERGDIVSVNYIKIIVIGN